MTVEQNQFVISQPQRLVNPTIQKLLSCTFEGLAAKMCDRVIVISNPRLPQEKPAMSEQWRSFTFKEKLNNVFLVLSRRHPGTLGDAGVRLLQLQLGEGAHQPQRHRALLWRERQTPALLRHVEERLRHRGGRQARLLVGRRQLLRQVGRKRQKIQALANNSWK